MAYNKTIWENDITPVSASNMNKIEDQIEQNTEALSIDYIVEQGTSGIWRYRKWNSGIVELWGRWSGTLTNYATVNSWYGYNTGSISLPFTVYEPCTQISARVGSGFAHSGNCYTAAANASISTIIGYAIANSSGSQGCVFHFRIDGRWKV